MENPKEDDHIKDAMATHNHAEAEFGLRAWCGARFYCLINCGRVPFKTLSNKKYQTRNVWTGWLFRMVLIFGGLGLVWMLATALM